MNESATILCARARRGDPDAAAELVTGHYGRLYGWFYRLTGNAEDAADLTQKTFGRAWPALTRFEGRSSFSTWLHGIGHHVYLDWRRRQRPTEHRSDAWWLSCTAPGQSPFQSAAERDQAAQLYGLVESLNEETRHTLHLHYYEGLSLAETAEALGVATSTVKYRLRQALDSLRRRWREPESSLKGSSLP